MRTKILSLHFIVAAIAWSSCAKDNAQTNPSPSAPGSPASTEFNPKVTLVAGSETEYGSKTDCNPLDARFFGITKLVLDTRDNKTALYVIDQSDNALRIIEGNKIRTINNIVGIYGLAQSICLAPGRAGMVYLTSGYGQLVLFDVYSAFNPGTNPKVIIDRTVVNGNQTGLGGTRGLAVDNNGDIYFGNGYINAVTKYSLSNKTITPFAGVPLADMADEPLPFADGNSLTKAVFGDVSDIAIDEDGKVYVADRLYRTIREIDNGQVKALFSPSPYWYENYIQKSVDGPLDKAKSAMIEYVAVPSLDKNRVFFCTAGALRVILLNENRVVTLAQFPQSIHGMTPAPDGKTVYVASGYGIVKVELGK